MRAGLSVAEAMRSQDHYMECRDVRGAGSAKACRANETPEFMKLPSWPNS